MNAKRGGRTTKEQYNILVDFVEKNTEILYPRKSHLFGEKHMQKKWEILKNCLNGSGAGPIKSIKQWKKVVSELKLHTKKKFLMNRAGGGYKKWHFLNYEERFLKLLKPLSSEGSALPEMDIETKCTADLQEPEYNEPVSFFVKTEEEEVPDPIPESTQPSSESSREPVDVLENWTKSEQHNSTVKSKATSNHHASRFKRKPQGLYSTRTCSYLLKKYEELIKNQLEVQERIAESNNNLAHALNNVSSSLDNLACILKKQ